MTNLSNMTSRVWIYANNNDDRK